MMAKIETRRKLSHIKLILTDNFIIEELSSLRILDTWALGHDMYHLLNEV